MSMKRERRPNEYMDLENEHRLSEQAAKNFKPIPPGNYQEQSSHEPSILKRIAYGLLEFIVEIIFEFLLNGL